MKLYTTFDVGEDCAVLQRKLDDVYQWACTWQMTISYKKCCIMFVHSKRDNDNDSDLVFRLGDITISTVNSVRDLGVIVNTNLNPHDHIVKIVSQAFVRVNLIFKCFLSKDVRTLTRAFISYVRPLLEYASVSWSPCCIKDIELLEAVQRKFTKRLLGAHGTQASYPERLVLLNLESLELRRLRCDLLYTYKLLFGMVDIDARDFFTFCNNGHCTRGHAYKLSMNYSRLDIRKFYFCERVVKPWNSLPAKPEHFTSIRCFKSFLSNVDLSEFLRVFPRM